jgi:tryptophan synthase beta chain
MLDMKAVIYMGATDVVRQAPNVGRMRLMGAEIVAVESGTKTLKDAINAALRRWLSDQENTHYCFGTAAGPHPFPTLVREFQQIISKEAREQFMARNEGNLPDVVVACVGGGSNAIGMFHNFVPDESVKIVGVEAAGTGEPGCYSSAPIDHGTDGVLHGMMTKLLQTEDGQIEPSHSIAPGLDYPGVGPEHAHLDAIGRVDYTTINDSQAINAFKALSRREGIIPALESSHAVAYAIENREQLQGKSVLVCLSGRGDKDLGILDQIL